MSESDLSFKLLSTLSKERAVYGLRNGDFERYRRHCANKVHRLRQVTNNTCGKGKTYKTPPKLDASTVKDVRELQLALFSAERALAHSHDLKSQRNKPNAPAQAVKKEQISWLRRALKLSASLFETVSTLTTGSGDSQTAKVNQRTLAEVTIYYLTVRSELSFERNDFISALSDLAARRRLLGVLAESAKDSYDEALAHEFIDAQDPLIRYCAYKLGRADSHDIDGVMADITEDVLLEALPIYSKLTEGLKKELGSEMQEGRKKLEDVTFGGEKVDFRNAELVRVMGKVQDELKRAEGKNGKGKSRGMSGWDRVLAVLGEAEGVARKLVEDHESSRSSTSLRSAQVSNSLSFAHEYIVHLLLSHRIKRDLQLIDVLTSSLSSSLPTEIGDFKIRGGKVKIEETVKGLAGIVKLLDTVLQSLRGMAELSIVQEKEGVRLGVEGSEAYYHASKCLTLARLHCIHPTPSYGSAVSLLSRASPSVDQARALLGSPSSPLEEVIVEISPVQIETLEADIQKLDTAAKKGLFAAHIEKPVFFDMAFNYIDIPFDELEVLAGKQKAPTTTQVISEQVGKVAQSALGGVDRVKKLGRETREATPAPEAAVRPAHTQSQKTQDAEDEEVGEEEEDEKETTSQKKGWLGGWFGRGK
ncbi:signal recognition particle subunit SRP68 [Kwoniella heveanensis CBS 569]|nr:signal recognition particle subunit SRP68 [Kwoniella heveanensis CBS 569]